MKVLRIAEFLHEEPEEDLVEEALEDATQESSKKFIQESRKQFIQTETQETVRAMRYFMHARGIRWSPDYDHYVGNLIRGQLRLDVPQNYRDFDFDRDEFQRRWCMLWSLASLADCGMNDLGFWPEEKKLRLFKLIEDGRVRNKMQFADVHNRWYPNDPPLTAASSNWYRKAQDWAWEDDDPAEELFEQMENERRTAEVKQVAKEAAEIAKNLFAVKPPIEHKITLQEMAKLYLDREPVRQVSKAEEIACIAKLAEVTGGDMRLKRMKELLEMPTHELAVLMELISRGVIKDNSDVHTAYNSYQAWMSFNDPKKISWEKVADLVQENIETGANYPPEEQQEGDMSYVFPLIGTASEGNAKVYTVNVARLGSMMSLHGLLLSGVTSTMAISVHWQGEPIHAQIKVECEPKYPDEDIDSQPTKTKMMQITKQFQDMEAVSAAAYLPGYYAWQLTFMGGVSLA